MNKMNKKGFTIVELVIVIAVIAILAGVLIPTFGGIITKANESAALQDIVAAQKNAYVEIMADGKVETTEQTKEYGKYTFIYDTKGKLLTAKETSDAKYTYTVSADGAITAAKEVG